MRVARNRGYCSRVWRTKGQIRIDNGRPQRLGVLKAFHLNGAPYGVGVDVQGLRNRADFPMLGVEIAANLYAGFGTDHRSSPSSWNLWERIDEAAWPTTNRAAQPEIGAFFLPTGQPRWQRDRNRHRDRFSPAEWCRRNDRKGTLIRHASRRVTVPVRTLPVAVIESALQTPLVAAIGLAALPAPSFGAAGRAAIALSAIAVPRPALQAGFREAVWPGIYREQIQNTVWHPRLRQTRGRRSTSPWTAIRPRRRTLTMATVHARVEPALMVPF